MSVPKSPVRESMSETLRILYLPSRLCQVGNYYLRDLHKTERIGVFLPLTKVLLSDNHVSQPPAVVSLMSLSWKCATGSYTAFEVYVPAGEIAPAFRVVGSGAWSCGRGFSFLISRW